MKASKKLLILKKQLQEEIKRLSEQNRKATGGGLVMCQCGGNIPDCQGVMIGNKVNCTCCGSCAEMQGGKELR